MKYTKYKFVIEGELLLHPANPTKVTDIGTELQKYMDDWQTGLVGVRVDWEYQGVTRIDVQRTGEEEK